MKKILWSIVVILFAVAAGSFVYPKVMGRIERARIEAEQQRVRLPDPEPASSRPAPSSSAESVSSSASSLRDAVNYDVPFTSQAPLANWDALHEEACEEASVLMVLRYFQGKTFASPDDAEAAIQELVASNAALGFPVDDTAEQLVTLIGHADPSLVARVIEDPTVDQLKELLAGRNLIIVPAAGKQLGNPYYTYPGPEYHMLVLKGYTSDGYFITNDPGTKRGENFVYRFDVLLNATHDWNGGAVESGARRVVVVSKP